jgi:hypothetical protein
MDRSYHNVSRLNLCDLPFDRGIVWQVRLNLPI